METLDAIGEGESTTFVLPQELSSLVGRYGKHLTGSDVAENGTDALESLNFDAETEELLGLDDVDELVGEIGVEEVESDLATESVERSDSE
jgi:hypothetical protein